ncbi:hypothetical protein BZG36_00186 [Bifiguratus adelaidae]|uniref:DNA primase large subunit n=1 Tax=Bifiguratus adelaidae TaxID=1938954 RepID=A0A261Y8D7_9FUNG|nr:hypothetical protein BZG36_00186 [Bifiguratus adelaidae]
MFKQKPRANRFAEQTQRTLHGDAGQVRVHSAYPSRLNFYLVPPQYEITVDEFEEFALDRLHVLKALEGAQLRNKSREESKQQLDTVSDKYLPLHSNQAVKAHNVFEERRKDHISHFILRLAYCRSEELRSWFLRQECALFRHRYENESMAEKHAFLDDLQLDWKVLSNEEKKEIFEELVSASAWHASQYSGQNVGLKERAKAFVESEGFFEVNFERVPELVSRRLVYIRNGKAYVPMSEQVSLVLDEFRNRLSKALEVTAKMLPRMDEDERLMPVLNNINKQYLGKDYGAQTKGTAGAVTADEVDSLVAHFPPCMRHLHMSLRHDKHLRHGGRMQYGLFLKAIGLPIEEALVFWRRAFANMTEDQFQKGYAYNIRHNYGLEGKRADYKPYDCMRIITSNPPSTGDHHGCPFRHFSSQNLEEMLFRYGVPQTQIREFTNLVSEKHFNVACTRLFELTKKLQGADASALVRELITHPNQWFEASYKSSKAAEDPNAMQIS